MTDYLIVLPIISCLVGVLVGGTMVLLVTEKDK